MLVSNVHLQINDAMRILTVFNAILLRLTFITGIYGITGIDMTKSNAVPQDFSVIALIIVIITPVTLCYSRKNDGYFILKLT